MGQVPLDLPDPLDTKPLASARGADELLSQMAGDEIDRLLAKADLADDDGDEREAADQKTVDSRASTKAIDRRAAKPAPPQGSEGDRGESAVSSFVADGDPALEAELDSLLANLNGAAAELSDSGIVVPPGGKQTPESSEAAVAPEAAPEIPAELPTAAVSPAPTAGAQSAEDGKPAQTGELSAHVSAPFDKLRTEPANLDNSADPIVTSELDQVFDKMTASAGAVPPVVNGTVPEPAASIDLLKVLDPIVARDAAKAEKASAAQAAADGTKDEDGAAEGRAPFYVVILEWINAPLGWLSPAVRDALGKVGIMTLINAAAVLLWVLFFRRR